MKPEMMESMAMNSVAIAIEGDFLAEGEIMAMTVLPVNQEGCVSSIDVRCREKLQVMMAMGIVPGVRVKMIQTFPSILFEAGYSQFAIDKEMAGSISVQVFKN